MDPSTPSTCIEDNQPSGLSHIPPFTNLTATRFMHFASARTRTRSAGGPRKVKSGPERSLEV